MDDTISRAAALNCVYGTSPNKIKGRIAELPSAQPDKWDDTVYRKAVEMLLAHFVPEERYAEAVDGLRRLPSAQLAQDLTNGCTDTISRAAALNALGERPVIWSDNDDYTLGERNQYDMDRLAIETVPPAQPGQRNARVFQGIIVEYPSISAYPEYEGKPYFSIKYTENGQEFIGYGTYKPEVLSEFLKEYFMLPTQPGWIPTSERLPDNDRAVLVTLKWAEDDYEVAVGEYWHNSTASHGWGSFEGHVIAWHELPTPYREGGQDGKN